MSAFIKQLSADKIVWWSILGSISLLLLCVLYLLFVYPNLPPYLPIYNQMPWGEEKLGTKPEIFLPIGIGMLFLIINALFSMLFYSKMPLVSRMLSIASLFISVTIVIFLFRTTQLLL
jgi:hypothetical protein